MLKKDVVVGLGEIGLTSEGSDTIEQFDITWRYQSFEASSVNF